MSTPLTYSPLSVLKSVKFETISPMRNESRNWSKMGYVFNITSISPAPTHSQRNLQFCTAYATIFSENRRRILLSHIGKCTFQTPQRQCIKLVAKDRHSRNSHFFFDAAHTLHWWINLYKEDTATIRMYTCNGWRMATNFVDQQHQPKRFFKSIVLRKWPKHEYSGL